MAKRFLLNLLIERLGQYVEGLTEENLRVGVLSGRIELKNLKLKASALDDLDIPVEVSHGTLRSLKLEVPWASLDRKPVKVFIDGVLLQAAPIDVNCMSKSNLREKLLMSKRAQLDKVDTQFEESHKKLENQATTNRKLSYTERLIVKILDNLEVTVSNVHIRYEDSLSCPGVTFAAGISLSSFTVATTEWNWSKTFLSRETLKTGEGFKIHKLANLENIAFYWDQVEVPLSTLRAIEWEEAMMSLVFQDSVLAKSPEKFILSPPNTICVKLIHVDKPTEIEPQLDVSLEGLNLEFRLSKLQLSQIIFTLNTFYALDRQKLVALYRPDASIKENPKAWWKYAYTIISGKKGGFAANVEDALLCHRNKARYIQLLKMKRSMQFTSEEIERDLMSIERALPLCALTIFRGIAIKEYYKELSEVGDKAKSAVKASASKSSWFSWGKKKESSYVSHISEDEDISFETLTASLEESSIDELEYIYILRLRLRDASCSLELHHNEASIALAMTSYGVSLDMRSTGVSAAFTVENLIILDRVTTNNEVQAIVAPRGDVGEEHRPFLVVYNARPARTDISITSFPLTICFNRPCTKELINYFTFPVSNDTSAIYLRKKFLQIVSPYFASNTKVSEINFALDIRAPIVIIPENNDGDTGCLHLDMGHCVIQGSFENSDFHFESTLSDVHMCLPLKTRFKRVDDTDDIISPFTVHFTASSRSKEVSNVLLNLDVTSPVICVFNEIKFSRLLKVIQLTRDLLKRKSKDREVIKEFNPKAIPISFDEEKIEDSIGNEDVIIQTCIKFSLPCVTLCLNNSEFKNSINAEMQKFELKIVKSNVDTILDLAVNSFKLNDDYGHIFVWTNDESSCLIRNAFVSIRFVSISSIRSPLYLSHASMLTIFLGNLGINYSTLVLVTLKPFYDAVQKEYAQRKSRTMLIAKKASKTMALVVDKAFDRKSLNGMQVTATIDQIWVTLQTIDDEDKVSNKVESFFKICAQNLSFTLGIKKSIDVVLKLSILDVMDIRPVSQYYVYRTLLTKTSDLSLATNLGSQEAITDFLKLTFSDSSVSTNEIDLLLQDLTSYVSIDALLDLVHLTMGYIKELKIFLSTPLTEDNNVPCNIVSEVEAKSTGTVVEASLSEKNVSSSTRMGKRLYVGISIINPTLLLLEDPLDRQSRGIIGCCVITAHYNEDLDASGSLVGGKLQISLNDSDISVFRNIEDRSGAVRVLEPCRVQLHMATKYDRSILFECNTFVDIHSCSAKMTTGDVLLLTSILSRVAFVRQNDSIQFSDDTNSKSPIKVRSHANEKSDFKSVVALTITASVGSFSLSILDDTKGFVLPIFVLSIGNFDVTANGTFEALMGGVTLNLSILHYNFLNGNWEPFLENATIGVKLQRQIGHTKADVFVDSEVQVNVTLLMWKSILQTATRMRLDETKIRSITVKPFEHATWIENHLGFDISIVSDTEVLILKGHDIKAALPSPSPQNSLNKYKTTLPPESFKCLDANTKLVDLRSVSYKTLHALPVFVNRPISFFLHMQGGEDVDPVKIIWDSVFEDGVRKIKIRSPIMFINRLDYPLALRASLKSDEIVDLGSVEENGGIFYLPVELVDDIIFFKAKPALLPTGWSPNCMLVDYTSRDSSYPMNFTCIDQYTKAFYSAVIFSNVDPTSIKIIFSYNIHLINALPCLMRYRCVCDGEILVESILLPGRQKRLSYALSSTSTFIQISVGSLDWGPPIYSAIKEMQSFELKECRDGYWRCRRCLAENLITSSSALVCSECNFQRPTKLKYEEDTISITYFVKVEKFLTSIHVFSKYALIDRSGLGIGVFYNSITKNSVVRRSLRESDKTDDFIEKTIGMTIHNIPRLPAGSLAIESVVFQSERPYEVSIWKTGNLVFTDRSLTWIHIPNHFENATYICTPCEDKILKIGGLIQFNLTVPSVVVILRDSCLVSSISWLSTCGYYPIIEQFTAQRRRNSIVEDIYFCGFAKYFDQGVTVTLDGNNSFDWANSMYTVCIVPISSDSRVLDLLRQITIDKDPGKSDPYVWVEGGKGVSLFNPVDNKLKFGIVNKDVWSEMIHLEEFGSSNLIPFDINDTAAGILYQLAYKISAAPGLFRSTYVVTVVPRFCIVNCTREVIRLRQKNIENGPVFGLESQASKTWHPCSFSLSTDLFVQTNTLTDLIIRTTTSKWSSASFDIDEIGTSVIVLRDRKDSSDRRKNVLSIDVRFSSKEENSYIVVTIWESSIRKNNSSISVRNATDDLLCCIQADAIDEETQNDILWKKDLLLCEPSSTIPFGWIKNFRGNYLVRIGKVKQKSSSDGVGLELSVIKNTSDSTFVDKVPDNIESEAEIEFYPNAIDFNAIDNVVCLDDTTNACVQIWGPGKILIISKRSKIEEAAISLNPPATFCSEFTFTMKGISLSLVAESPFRRELAVFNFQAIRLRYSKDTFYNILDFKVGNLQIDNYSDPIQFPVIFYTQKTVTKEPKEALTNAPFFHLLWVQNRFETKIPKYKYIAVLVLEFYLFLDSSTLKHYLTDVHEQLRSAFSLREFQATETPDRWIDQFNIDIVSIKMRTQLVNIPLALLRSSRSTKLFVEQFVVHPIKAHITFAQCPFGRSDVVEKELTRKYPWIEKIAFLSLEDVILRLNAFSVQNALESIDTFTSRLLNKTKADVQQQLVRILGSFLGSLDVLGKPVGLAKNIGGGIQGFFYEPAVGLMESPEKFVLGLGKGTSGLVTGVVGGAVSSAFTIVKTATTAVGHGAAIVAGESDQYNMRQSRRLSGSQGILGGLKEGGASLVYGLKDGLTGLVQKPLEGGKKDGLLGFAKGVGMGILGAAARPVMGVTEGLSSIATGITSDISSLTSSKTKVEQLRPQRALNYSRWDKFESVLTNLNIQECYAQDLIRKKPKQVGVPTETFFAFVFADEETYIIFSSTHVYIMTSSFVTIRSMVLDDIQAFNVVDKLKIDVQYLGVSVAITCTNEVEFQKLEQNFIYISRRLASVSSIVNLSLKVHTDDSQTATKSSASQYLQFVYGKSSDTFSCKTISDENFLLSIKDSFKHTDLSPGDLDRQINYLVRQWEANHGPGSGNIKRGSGVFGSDGMFGTAIGGIRTVRCAGLLILNESTSTIKILAMNLIIGERLCIFGDGSYSDGSNTIAPHSAVILFICGSRPKLVETSDAAAEIQTTAFKVTFGRKKEVLKFEGSPGFEASFLVKDYGASWGKHILLIV